MRKKMVVWRWWAEWSEFGEESYIELYFSSYSKMKDYGSRHRLHNNFEDTYESDHEPIEVL